MASRMDIIGQNGNDGLHYADFDLVPKEPTHYAGFDLVPKEETPYCEPHVPGSVTPTGISATLAERGSRYGDFTDHARIAQQIQDVMRGPGASWGRLNAVQRQALTVIADKIARVLSGDPDYADNWHDIQGYAKLVEDRLPQGDE